MDKIRIRGGQQLNGTIRIGGAKNAALPLMAACLLTDEPLILSNVPHLADITTMANLLGQHGAQVSLEGQNNEGGHTGRVMSLTARDITSTTAPYDLVRRMRASVLVLGPLVAREGVATVSLPGGCAIGARRRESYIHEYFKPSYLRHGVRLELLDVLVEQQGPRAVLLVALEAWSCADLHRELEERAPLV